MTTSQKKEFSIKDLTLKDLVIGVLAIYGLYSTFKSYKHPYEGQFVRVNGSDKIWFVKNAVLTPVNTEQEMFEFINSDSIKEQVTEQDFNKYFPGRL